MFISKQEAEDRVSSSRNPFSSNFKKERTSPVFEAPTDVIPALPTAPDDPSDEPEEEVEQASGRDSKKALQFPYIDRLLKDAKDPYRQDTPIKDLETQIAIGTVSTVIGSAAAGAMYDRSQDQARCYENGFGSTHEYDGVNGKRRPSNQTRIQEMQSVKERIASLASQRLIATLGHLTDDKLEAEKSPTKLASISKDMAVVVDKVTREKHDEGTVHFHLWKPDLKQIADYQTVKLSAPIIEGEKVD